MVTSTISALFSIWWPMMSLCMNPVFQKFFVKTDQFSYRIDLLKGINRVQGPTYVRSTVHQSTNQRVYLPIDLSVI